MYRIVSRAIAAVALVAGVYQFAFYFGAAEPVGVVAVCMLFATMILIMPNGPERLDAVIPALPIALSVVAAVVANTAAAGISFVAFLISVVVGMWSCSVIAPIAAMEHVPYWGAMTVYAFEALVIWGVLALGRFSPEVGVWIGLIGIAIAIVLWTVTPERTPWKLAERE